MLPESCSQDTASVERGAGNQIENGKYEIDGPQPRQDSDGKPVRVRYALDPQLRDFENVSLKENIDDYFRREVLPHVPDAWMDRSKDKVGYEINFNRHFYKYTPPRPLEEIDRDLRGAEGEIVRLLREVTA